MAKKEEWQRSVDWAKEQKTESGIEVQSENNKINHHYLVYFVRKFFNENDIEYNNFSYNDLKKYL